MHLAAAIGQSADAFDRHAASITILKNSGGLRATPTPGGVPVKIKSLGLM